MIKKRKTDYTIHTVSDALDILEQFHDDVDELGVAELSRRLKLHKNKVFRLLATLESRNYIDQNVTTGNYRLGPESLHLGQAFAKRLGLLRQALPVQESLTRKCKETSYVTIMKNFQIICLNAVESDLPVRVVPRVGEKLPMYCTAAGKVLAAGLKEEVLLEYLHASELKRYTENTISDRDELANHLHSISNLGYAVEDEELDVGVKSVGAPIRDYTRNVIGAVSVSGPSMRLSAERMDQELIPLVKKAAEEISTKLGFY